MQIIGISRMPPGGNRGSECCWSPSGHSLGAEGTTDLWVQVCQAKHQDHIRCTVRKPDRGTIWLNPKVASRFRGHYARVAEQPEVDRPHLNRVAWWPREFQPMRRGRTPTSQNPALSNSP